MRICDDNDHKLDFSILNICWKVPQCKTHMLDESINIFEDCDDDENTINYDKMTDLLHYLMKYDESDKNKYREIIYQYLWIIQI